MKSDVTFTAHFKQISEYPDESEITNATIEDVRFNYGAGEAPIMSAFVTPVDYEKYDVAYECWQQFENNEPVAAWYSDNGSHGSLPTFTKFEGGKNMCIPLCLNQRRIFLQQRNYSYCKRAESVRIFRRWLHVCPGC